MQLPSTKHKVIQLSPIEQQAMQLPSTEHQAMQLTFIIEIEHFISIIIQLCDTMPCSYITTQD